MLQLYGIVNVPSAHISVLTSVTNGWYSERCVMFKDRYFVRLKHFYIVDGFVEKNAAAHRMFADGFSKKACHAIGEYHHCSVLIAIKSCDALKLDDFTKDRSYIVFHC